jgi:hypothetical protein
LHVLSSKVCMPSLPLPFALVLSSCLRPIEFTAPNERRSYVHAGVQHETDETRSAASLWPMPSSAL